VSVSQIAEWFDTQKRDLPWRAPECGAWGVLISEVMLQQTPVARVIPKFLEWTTRWPTPEALAGDSLAEAVKAWDRLGYPRRAKRLHEAARQIVELHGGKVPRDLDALLALPGVGDYTARAVRCFAFGIPEAVVDTNVRRVIARAITGVAEAGPPRTTADRAVLSDLLAEFPTDESACSAAAGLMELGAVICQARKPLCDQCPLAAVCQWRLAGYPAYVGAPAPKQARYEGSDRQVRGVILRELRHSDTPVPEAFLAGLWPDRGQFDRAFASLVSDGLIRETPGNPGWVELPSEQPGLGE
jgi:A/G-specific adenine glycosylase